MTVKYDEKPSQKKRLLECLQAGNKVCQIDLNYYLQLRHHHEDYLYIKKSEFVDAIADLGIANLPARIYGLKKDGYEIETEKISVNGRFCKTFYYVYFMKKI